MTVRLMIGAGSVVHKPQHRRSVTIDYLFFKMTNFIVCDYLLTIATDVVRLLMGQEMLSRVISIYNESNCLTS